MKIIKGQDNTKGNSVHQLSKAMDRKEVLFYKKRTEVT